MPHDRRLVLGFVGPAAITAAAAELGLVFLDEDDLPIDYDADEVMDIEAEGNAVDAALERAYAQAVVAIGGTVVLTDGGFGPKDAEVALDGKTYSANPFSLTHFFDSTEVGDEPEHAVLGVALDERYRRVFLDMRPGGSNATTCDLDALEDRIAVARAAIVAELPVFARATLVVKDVFY